MGQRLDDYCEEHFGDLVRVLRAPTRLGLIKAKNFGAKNGWFLCFRKFISILLFSSNRRCSGLPWCTLWSEYRLVNKSKNLFFQKNLKSRLEPLVNRIKEKHTAVLCPMIDSISSYNLAYHSGSSSWIGVFTWSLHFAWSHMFPRVQRMRNSSIDPIP